MLTKAKLILSFTLFSLWSCSGDTFDENWPTQEGPYPPNKLEGWELISDSWPVGALEIWQDGDHILCKKNQQLYISKDSCRIWNPIGPEYSLLYRVNDTNTIYLVQTLDGVLNHIGGTKIFKSINNGISFNAVKEFKNGAFGALYATNDSVYCCIVRDSGQHTGKIYDTYYTFDTSFQHQQVTLKPHPNLFSPVSKYQKISPHFDYLKKQSDIVIRRYHSSNVVDSLILSMNRVQEDLRNFHFVSPTECYYTNEHGISKFDFLAKSDKIIQDTLFPDTWIWLRKARDGFIFNYKTSESYGLFQTNKDSLNQLFRYDYRYKNELNYTINHDIVKLEYMFGNSYLYMFVSDGRIWRYKI